MTRPTRHIIIFGLISRHAGRNYGGTAVSIGRLANYFVESGLEVTIAMRRPDPEHFLLKAARPGVGFHFFRSASKAGIFLELLIFILSAGSLSVLALDSKACQIASWLKAVPGLDVRVWASFRGVLSENKKILLGRIARRCDGVIAISRGMAAEFLCLSSAPAHKVHVIHNLVVTPELLEAAAGNVEHPWFQDRHIPIIIGVGRLVPLKGFDVLIRAFAGLRVSRPARLMIIGEGPERTALERVAGELGVHGDVDLCGFQENPWAFMKRSSVFVHASRQESFGNVIAEAMALGIPVVSTDCPYGPRDILDDGRFGRLVPVDDDRALAQAILETLDNPPLPQDFLIGARRFTAEYAGRKYVETMGLECGKQPGPGVNACI